VIHIIDADMVDTKTQHRWTSIVTEAMRGVCEDPLGPTTTSNAEYNNPEPKVRSLADPHTQTGLDLEGVDDTAKENKQREKKKKKEKK
jgi:hypothetical protein